MLPSATCGSHVLEVHVLAFRRWLSLGASAPGPLGHVGEAVWGLLAPWNQLFVKTQALWASPLDPDSTRPGMGPGTLPSSRVERGFVCEGCLHPVPQIKLCHGWWSTLCSPVQLPNVCVASASGPPRMVHSGPVCGQAPAVSVLGGPPGSGCPSPSGGAVDCLPQRLHPARPACHAQPASPTLAMGCFFSPF